MIKLINSTKQQIISTPPPPSTRTYKTISHGEIIDRISESLDKEGFIISKEFYSGNLNNSVVRGHLQLGLAIDGDLKFEIAFLNSYDKSKRAVVVGGSQVIICENGHILGDTKYGSFKRKHSGTADQDIKIFIPEMVKSANEAFEVLIKQKERMKEIELSKKVRNELVAQLYFDDAIIADTQMSILKKEFDKSSFDYGSPNSLWETYNHVTFAMKGSHPSKWFSNHQELNKIVNDRFQLDTELV